jgi:hypothetical protein
MEQDLFFNLVTDWRFVAAIVGVAVAIGEARVRLQRLIEIHKPEVMIAEAEDRGRVRADFITAQQDIIRLEKSYQTLEKKTRTDLKEIHAKIERNLGDGTGN